MYTGKYKTNISKECDIPLSGIYVAKTSVRIHLNF